MRFVLDTNVVLSAILFSRGRLTWLRQLWREGGISPLSSRETVAELVRVLTYPKFDLTGEDVETLLSAYLPYCELVAAPRRSPGLPRCSDGADQMFLLLAAVGKAGVLVTGDRALLDVGGPTHFAIETPARFKARFS